MIQENTTANFYKIKKNYKNQEQKIIIIYINVLNFNTQASFIFYFLSTRPTILSVVLRLQITSKLFVLGICDVNQVK